MNVMSSRSFPMNEPLAELAAFAFDWAHCLCDPQAACESYHRGWSIVRHVEAGGALPSGQEFFGRWLRGLARAGRVRILLSGAADTGLAAMVLQQLRPHGIEPEMVLVDRCLTTLEQNRLFARHAGFDLQTLQMDAADVEIPAVDAIVVHSFLGFFPPDTRHRIVEMWVRNLAPHGQVLISNRLSDGEGAIHPDPDPEALARRKASIQATAVALGYTSARAAGIADAAEALWRYRHAHSHLGEAELLRLLGRAGLAILQMDKDASGTNVSPLVMDSFARRKPRAELVVVHAAPRPAT